MKKTIFASFMLGLCICTTLVLSACDDIGSKLTSATYQAFTENGTITYELSQQGDETPMMTVTAGDINQTFAVGEDAMRIAEEYCTGFTLWDLNAGDIDSRIGTLSLKFNNGQYYEFPVVGPLSGKHTRGEADKVANYIKQQAENHMYDFDINDYKAAMQWQKSQPKPDVLW